MYSDIFFIKYNILNIININKIFINRVGIKNYYQPFIFDDNSNKLQKILGLWNIGNSVQNYKRGVHMSRFLYILNKFLNKIISLKLIFKFYKFFNINNSNDFFLQLSFIYFIKKISPISLNSGLMNYKITLFLKKNNIFKNFLLKLIVPINTLCPCSKSISLYNAHNQRSYVSIFILLKKNLNIYKLLYYIEKQSSISLWSFLKRVDEKYFTEYSYNNPKFIEDLTRSIYNKFKKFKFFLKLENLESIHNHNVYSFCKNF
ncbi:GTP cyclohydrolase I type 2 [Candidatus Nasuia deltocephalinicola]|uniref:GTP cyclohydrolase I type 2 n=1 Tax=Candidatus Nasuia deltocephalincola TaxID=1160784 RepID=A0A0S2UP97_9PROT|nr:GTP cyclohydrolase I type 2 [Candidatus Nasuia deltocephalinicola]